MRMNLDFLPYINWTLLCHFLDLISNTYQPNSTHARISYVFQVREDVSIYIRIYILCKMRCWRKGQFLDGYVIRVFVRGKFNICKTTNTTTHITHILKFDVDRYCCLYAAQYIMSSHTMQRSGHILPSTTTSRPKPLQITLFSTNKSTGLRVFYSVVLPSEIIDFMTFSLNSITSSRGNSLCTPTKAFQSIFIVDIW